MICISRIRIKDVNLKSVYKYTFIDDEYMDDRLELYIRPKPDTFDVIYATDQNKSLYVIDFDSINSSTIEFDVPYGNLEVMTHLHEVFTNRTVFIEKPTAIEYSGQTNFDSNKKDALISEIETSASNINTDVVNRMSEKIVKKINELFFTLHDSGDNIVYDTDLFLNSFKTSMLVDRIDDLFRSAGIFVNKKTSSAELKRIFTGKEVDINTFFNEVIRVQNILEMYVSYCTNETVNLSYFIMIYDAMDGDFSNLDIVMREYNDLDDIEIPKFAIDFSDYYYATSRDALINALESNIENLRVIE